MAAHHGIDNFSPSNDARDAIRDATGGEALTPISSTSLIAMATTAWMLLSAPAGNLIDRGRRFSATHQEMLRVEETSVSSTRSGDVRAMFSGWCSRRWRRSSAL